MQPAFKALPRTPEEYIRQAEDERDLLWAYADNQVLRDPRYDNWYLWLIYKWRTQDHRSMTTVTETVGKHVPAFVNRDRKVRVTDLAEEVAHSPRTVQKHLDKLVMLGADFSRIANWPHPLDGPTTSNDRRLLITGSRVPA